MGRSLKITLTPAAEHAVRGGHPWVFADRVRSQNRDGLSGELAVIYDRRDRFLAVGLYDSQSPIRVRVLAVGDPVKIDDGWFRRQVLSAVTVRENHFEASETTGYRWVNGESDGLPGLVIDRYGEVGVVKLYTAAWLPAVASGRLLDWVRASCPGLSIWVLRLSRNTQDAARAFHVSDGDVLVGDPVTAAVTELLENGVKFEAEPVRGQKTGYFLDQRDNRLRVRNLARGADVLNVFSHAGGFSVHAAAGGARSATDLDISGHALDAALRNMALNQNLAAVGQCHHETVQADAFVWLAATSRGDSRKHAKRTYDIVVIDPPSLAKKQSESGRAVEVYQRLATSGLKLLRKGGLLVTSSCSAHVPADTFFKSIRQVVRRHGRGGRELFTSRHALDHPALIPEAHYLKCLAWQLD